MSDLRWHKFIHTRRTWFGWGKPKIYREDFLLERKGKNGQWEELPVWTTEL